jgi:anti-sigma factor RsiW
MSGDHQEDEIALSAYLDGALDTAGYANIEGRLAADPALAAHMAVLSADKALLRRIYQPLTERSLPKEWIARIEQSKPRSRAVPTWRLVGSIAAVLLVIVAGSYAYRHGQTSAPGEIVTAALDARAGSATGKRFTVSDAEARDYDKTVSNIVAAQVRVPDMRRLGYRLAEVRLYGGSGSEKAAELLYRDNAGRLFSLYLRHSDGSVRFDQFLRADLRVCIWQDDQVGMVMAGDVSTAAMQRLASLAYTGLTA